MKRNLLVCSIGALALGTLFSLSATAQTCAAPGAWQPDASGSPTVSGTTCGGDTTAPGYCAGNLDAPGPAYVIQSNFAASRTFTTLSLTGGAGYDAVMYVESTCGTNGACTATGDSTGGTIPSTDIPDGTFFIVISAATFDAPGACGTFTITSNGSFPVMLQDFTVS